MNLPPEQRIQICSHVTCGKQLCGPPQGLEWHQQVSHSSVPRKETLTFFNIRSTRSRRSTRLQHPRCSTPSKLFVLASRKASNFHKKISRQVQLRWSRWSISRLAKDLLLLSDLLDQACYLAAWVWSADLVGNSPGKNLKPRPKPHASAASRSVNCVRSPTKTTCSINSFKHFSLEVSALYTAVWKPQGAACLAIRKFHLQKELHKFGHQPGHYAPRPSWAEEGSPPRRNSGNQVRSMNGTFDKPVSHVFTNQIKVRQDRDQVSGINLSIVLYI